MGIGWTLGAGFAPDHRSRVALAQQNVITSITLALLLEAVWPTVTVIALCWSTPARRGGRRDHTLAAPGVSPGATPHGPGRRAPAVCTLSERLLWSAGAFDPGGRLVDGGP